MARKKAFDRDSVLAKAMHVFWCKGYEATSVEDLVQSMGINRGSLYDTFGDKRTLFLAAIAHYDKTIVAEAIARLKAPGASKQAIVDYVRVAVERAIVDEQRRGCLITNAAVELCPHDPETADCISTNLKQLEAAIYGALVAAREKGEISDRHNLRALAQFLASNLQGIRVMAKVNPDRAALYNVANVALSVLDN